MKRQSDPSMKSHVRASLTKLKNGLFTQFGKKSVIDEDWVPSVSTSKNKNNSTASKGNFKGQLSKSKNKNISTPSESNSKGQLFVFSRGKSKLFAV